VTYVGLKFQSPRPESFALYKRTREDGPWIPWQYYSHTCRDTYGLDEIRFTPPNDEGRVLCSNEFTHHTPLSGGEATFATLQGRVVDHENAKYDDNPVLQDVVTATDILITLNRLNTFGDERFRDELVYKSYYYAVSLYFCLTQRLPFLTAWRHLCSVF